jgi:hypothetical protein
MKKALLILLYVILNLVFFEVILSLFDSEEPMVKGYDKRLLFTLHPHRAGVVISKEYRVLVETNSLGFRQKGVEHSKPSVLVMGDSFTEGWGVEEKEIFVTQMNKTEGFEYRNLGLHGSSPLLYAIQIDPFLDAYQPKKVIIQLFDNDLDDNEKISAFVDFDSEGKPIGPKFRLGAVLLGEWGYNFLKDTSLYRLGARLVKLARKIPSPILYYRPGKEPPENILTQEQSLILHGGLASLGSEIDKKYSGQFVFYRDYNSSEWKERLKKNQFYLKILLEKCKSRGVELEFLYIPAKEFFAKNGILGDCTDCSLEERISRNPHEVSIFDFCQKENLVCHSGSQIFWNWNPEELYFPFDAHLNKVGHGILAEYFLGTLANP